MAGGELVMKNGEQREVEVLDQVIFLMRQGGLPTFFITTDTLQIHQQTIACVR